MTDRRQIRLLDDTVINKIAAGEVVERPASVVKELLENALDAGATQLDIEVIEGGCKLICVADNGCGMTADQATLAVQRHATSKIRDAKDVERIATMGFRGEALAAIPSVSRFALRTRVAHEVAGTEVIIHGGEQVDLKDAGCPPGTTIEVRNLFFNVPARRKFLRSPQTELSHIRQLILMYALAFPEIGLTLTADGRQLYQLSMGGTMEERLHHLFDQELTSALKPVDFTSGELQVTGFVAEPRYHRGDRTGQYMFINRRPASAPLLGYAINQGYESLLPKGRYPVVFLFLNIPPELVDVNVHPAKKEVRFRRPQAVRDVVSQSIHDALSQVLRAGLRSNQETPRTEGKKTEIETDDPKRGMLIDREAKPLKPVAQHQNLPYPRLGPDVGSREAEELDQPVAQKVPENKRTEPTSQDRSVPWEPDAEKGSSGTKSPWGRFRVLGVARNQYIILETDDGVVLLDPQAAHERIIFEKLVRGFEARRVESQGLLVPETVDMLPADAMLVRKHLKLFQELGFAISDFGGDTFMVEALPACFEETPAAQILREVAGGLERGGQRRGAGKWTAETVARAACRSAVHSKRALSMPEIQRLVTDLASAQMPYTCPHGRPTVIYMSFNELDRKFGRK